MNAMCIYQIRFDEEKKVKNIWKIHTPCSKQRVHVKFVFREDSSLVRIHIDIRNFGCLMSNMSVNTTQHPISLLRKSNVAPGICSSGNGRITDSICTYFFVYYFKTL